MSSSKAAARPEHVLKLVDINDQTLTKTPTRGESGALELTLSLTTKYALLVLVVTLAMIYAYGAISFENPEYSTWELHDYRAMAQASPGLATVIQQPFGYRILGSYLAGLLPFQLDTSFRVLSIALAITLALLLYYFLNSTGTGPRIAAVVTTFFVCNKYFFGFPVWNYYEVCDLLSFIEIVLLLWLMNSRKWFAFGIVLFAGALTKETVLLMIPVAFVYLIDQRTLASQWKPVLASVLPASVVAVALRILLGSGGGNNLAQALTAYGDKLLLPETWFRLLVNSFIPFAAFPLVFIGLTLDYFRTRRYAFVFLVLVLFSTFFGYNNERLMAPAFVVFYPLIASIMGARMTERPLILAILLGAAAVSSLHHTFTRFPIPREATIPIALAALGVVTLSLIYFRIRIERELPLESRVDPGSGF